MHHKYTFLDPSKTTRVSNPALKAIQKKAVQSYFERQKSSTNPIRDHSAVTVRQPMNARPQSLPLTNGFNSSSAKPMNTSRSSLPSNYAPQHFPAPIPHQSPTTSSPTATSNTVIQSTINQQQPSTPIKRPSVHSSPVLTKSSNTLSTSTATSHPLASPPSYHATFHQSAATYSANNATTVAANHHHHQQQQTQSAAMNMNRSGYHTDHHTNGEGFQSQADHGGQSNGDDSMNESGVPPPPPRRNRSMMPARRY